MLWCVDESCCDYDEIGVFGDQGGVFEEAMRRPNIG